MAHILVVDDDDGFRDGLTETLIDLGHEVVEARSGEEALARLGSESGVDCVFLDYRLPDMDGLAVLEQLRQNDAWRSLPVVMLTGYATSDNTIQAMRLGAYEHLMKPTGREEIRTVLAGIAAAGDPSSPAAAALGTFTEATGATPDKPLLLGASQALREVHKLLGRAAATDATVLITGETGTGKEVAARVLHDASARQRKPFVAVNCAAIPDELLESELFGHTKGAFTGAIAERPGRFVEADGGTLFLDEIGDMPVAMQAKLLRAIQERRVTPLGNDRSLPVDVRIVAATHRELAALVASGQFRDDLFYRLNVIPIDLPPLRDRLADILPLAEHFLTTVATTQGRPARGLSAAAQRRLVEYFWPGNVRELKNAMERVSALARGPAVTADELDFLSTSASPAGENLPPHWLDLPLSDVLERVERELIVRALSVTDGNRAEAARRLGISRQSLYAKMAAHRLK
ncbi:Transcriptional regulatory protein ZraR [Paraburkholderia domus]|uniref:sigma-54-dependent transcriptional regulator n=1 Tax=Paraburkholderia domus TaxID=2793075 RepID=UPI001912A191|nr:sigma-54 dependent transcriptional regulator [Paraburkholderia domus]MBK5090608.1 sigma-54-dependent Fis family transcriptional regulator [Burkholderia sp. R-69927]CAE6909268.1 Transcriptional regulatory protein ZraR [Paraburkholderia domus]